MKPVIDLRSLSVQMILSFVGIVILTSAAVGLPAIWLIRDQLNQQAWSQVDKGRRAALALYEAKQNEVESLAILTAQRPTLRELLLQTNNGVLEDYLENLKTAVGLDLVVVCDPTAGIHASTDISIPDELCATWSDGGYKILSSKVNPQVWFVANHPVQIDGKEEGEVIVGIELDDGFSTQIRDQTGLEHTVWATEQAVSTSLNARISQLGAVQHQGISIDASGDIIYSSFDLAGQPYYSALSQLDATRIDVEVILNVAEIAAIQTRMVLIIIGSMLVVAVMGSIIGIILARRISKPLVHLADTADEFRKGDLSSSVLVDSGVREITQVSQALENARIDLQRTLINLERERAWGNQLLESIVEGILILDQDGNITYFSPGAERLTGWSQADVLGNTVDQIFRLPDPGASFSQSIATGSVRSKLVVELADGHQATLAITKASLAPTEAGDSQKVLVFRDVSEGEIIHRILGNFLANIAHEFRTPLSAAAASIELLIDQAPDLSEKELGELLNSLHLGILGLQTLVDNLLETASIEAGRFRISPHPCDLAEIIGKAVQTMQPLLDKYGQRLVVELPTDMPVVNADARRSEQVLVNLLSNASRYGPADAEISIGVIVDQEWVKVQVADRGPGIIQDQRKYVFRRFMYPGILNDSTKAGAGLGLSVVKAVVEAHGGQAGIEDHPDGGSIFWFTLPLVDEG
jgi:PAS domain S-box-containing protein